MMERGSEKISEIIFALNQQWLECIENFKASKSQLLTKHRKITVMRRCLFLFDFFSQLNFASLCVSVSECCTFVCWCLCLRCIGACETRLYLMVRQTIIALDIEMKATKLSNSINTKANGHTELWGYVRLCAVVGVHVVLCMEMEPSFT